MDFLDVEGPFMTFLEKVVNLLWLNILLIVFSLPVFTAGAAFTAMHYVLYRMLKNEDGYIFKDFLKAFKRNFKQATKIWIPMLLMGIFLGVDVYFFYMGKVDISGNFKLLIYFLCFVWALGFAYIFPVLSRYENTTFYTIKNAYMMAVYGFLKSILMVALIAAPWIAAIFVPNFILMCMIYGFTVPGYLCATLYDDAFRRFELAEREAREAEEAGGSMEAENTGETGNAVEAEEIKEL